MTPLYLSLVDLLSVDAWTRRAAAAQGDIRQPAWRFALRRVLWQDSDATVRAAAALQLGRTKAQSDAPTVAEVASWLGDACTDEAPLVREAALRALSRMASRLPVLSRAELAKPASVLSADDPIWWVRRAALLAYGSLLSLQPDRVLPLLRGKLGDPFWRVRHAAAQALYAIGLRAPELRESILAPAPELSGPAQAGLWYLRARFQPSIDVYSFSASSPDGPVVNADPAVTTARLRAQAFDSIDPRTLIPFFADPHEPLRRLAFEHLRSSVRARQQRHGSASEEVQGLLRELLPWVETPTQPHAAETTAVFLDGLGEPALALCRAILAHDQPRPGALRWAASYAAQLASAELLTTLLRHGQHPKAMARAAVMAAVLAIAPRDRHLGSDSDTAIDGNADALRRFLGRGLADENIEVRSLAMLGIAQSRDAALVSVALRQSLSSLLPIARVALVDLAARQQHSAIVLRAARDSHPLVRARALRCQRSKAGESAAALSGDLADRDPEIRLAVLPARPQAWLSALRDDPDPCVRRSALRLLSSQRAREVLTLDEMAQAGLLACAAKDAWLRTHAAALIDTNQDAGLRALLRLSRDMEESVRAAAADRLQDPAIAARLRALLQAEDAMSGSASPRLSEDERAAAYAWIALHDGPEALALLEQAARSDGEPASVRSVLPALRFLASGDEGSLIEEAIVAPEATRRAFATATPAAVARRVLGRTGIQISPLGLSGAHEPPLSALHRARQAGVNLFFWEPSYLRLTRFLRRQCQSGAQSRKDLVIVAGSFEGDRFGIERDVACALRRLRTNYLDVLLLLWVRSPERLSQEALDCLRDLKRRGTIRAFGFSTHQRELAEAAAQTGDWDVLMLRHSAAHPGAEDRLLPLCAEKQIGVITFSALSYGRLLRSQPAVSEPGQTYAAGSPDPARMTEGDATDALADAMHLVHGEQIGPLPTAVDCYRYTLSQLGVSACWSAPRSYSELAENLAVLSAEPLPSADSERLRRHGQLVHAEDRRFRAFLRKGHDGAPEVLGQISAPMSYAESDAGTGESVNSSIADALGEIAEAGAPYSDPALPAHEVLAEPADYEREARVHAPREDGGKGAFTADGFDSEGNDGEGNDSEGNDSEGIDGGQARAKSSQTSSPAGSPAASLWSPWPSPWSSPWPLRSLLSRRRKPEKM